MTRGRLSRGRGRLPLTLLALTGISAVDLDAQLTTAPFSCGDSVSPGSTVGLNLATRQFSERLPFGESFGVKVTLPTLTPLPDSVVLRHGLLVMKETATGGAAVRDSADAAGRGSQRRLLKRYVRPGEVVFNVLPLERDRRYGFDFLFYTGETRTASVRIPILTETRGVLQVKRSGQVRIEGDSTRPVLVLMDSVRLAGVPRTAGYPVPKGSVVVRVMNETASGRLVEAGSIRVRALRDSAGILTLKDTAGVLVRKELADLFVRVESPGTVRSDSLRVVGRAETDITDHFDTDAGAIRSFDAKYWGGVTGMHFYRVPVNRNECPENFRGWDHLWKRLSLFAGLSVLRLHSASEVEHQFSLGSPVVGLGLEPRIPGFDPFRFWINGGVLFFQQEDANPLVTRKRNKRDYFLGLAIDVALADVLGPVAGLIGSN